jgi:glycerol uptake facilitator-like aquaporin
VYVLVALVVTVLDPLTALARAVVIGFVLFTLIIMALGTSGGHFNPYVTGANFLLGYMPGGYSLGALALSAAYIAIQLFAGLVAAWTFTRAHPPSVAPTIPNGLLNDDASGAVLFEWIGVTVIVLVFLQALRPCGMSHKAHWLGALAVGAAYLGMVNMTTLVGSGASLNFARSLGPAIVSGTWTSFGVYPLSGVLGLITAIVLHLGLRCGDDPSCWTRIFEDMMRDVKNVTKKPQC